MGGGQKESESEYKSTLTLGKVLRYAAPTDGHSALSPHGREPGHPG